jgi:RNA polymerase sigma factor (sigma-70 family)
MMLERALPREQTKQEGAVRYEIARQQLARALAGFSQELATGDVDSSRASELARRRAAVIDEGLRYFGPLHRFVRQEIEQWSELYTGLAGPISVDDAPRARAFYTWLRRIARRQARDAFLRQDTRRHTESSLYEPARCFGDWPDRAMRLSAILADPQAPLPENVLTRQEPWDTLRVVFRKLPEQWREIFLLSAVDGWDDRAIAQAEGMEVRRVRAINDATRAFLCDRLQDGAAFAEAGGGCHGR